MRHESIALQGTHVSLCIASVSQLEELKGRDARTLFLLETRLYDRRLLQASPRGMAWHMCMEAGAWLASRVLGVHGCPACSSHAARHAGCEHSCLPAQSSGAS